MPEAIGLSAGQLTSRNTIELSKALELCAKQDGCDGFTTHFLDGVDNTLVDVYFFNHEGTGCTNMVSLPDNFDGSSWHVYEKQSPGDCTATYNNGSDDVVYKVQYDNSDDAEAKFVTADCSKKLKKNLANKIFGYLARCEGNSCI